MWSIGLVKKQGWANVKKNLGMGILAAILLSFFTHGVDVINAWASGIKFAQKLYQFTRFLQNDQHAPTSFNELVSILTSFFSMGKGDFLSALGLLLSLVALGVAFVFLEPLWIGFHRWFLDNQQGRPTAEIIFMAFNKERYKAILLGSSWQLLWKNIWRITAIALMIPGASLILSGIIISAFDLTKWQDTPNWIKDTHLIIFLIPLGIIVLIISSVASLIIVLNRHYAYIFAPFLLAENPEIGALKALNASKAMAKGRKMKLFAFDLSFIGWNLLGLLTSGLLFLIITPYRYSALAEIYTQEKTSQRIQNIIKDY